MHFKTADLCDAHSDKIQILSPGLLNYGRKLQFCGRIVTLKLFEDNSLLRNLLGDAGNGQAGFVVRAKGRRQPIDVIQFGAFG